MKTDGAATSPSPAGRATRAHEVRHSRTPYLLLAAIQVAAAALALAFALVPGASGGAPPAFPITVAGVLLVLAAMTVWLLPRLPRGLGVDAGLAVGYAMAAASAYRSVTGEGQVLIGVGLTAYAVMAAYFLPRRRLEVSLVLMFGLYGTGVHLNQLLSSGAVFWMIVAVITGLAVLVSWLVGRLRDLALHDGLTGLLNRRGLDLLAPPLLSACARSGVPVTVGMVDLDRFKAFNDNHGHLEGDRLLRAVASRWSGALRESDLAARFGGDEFALVLAGSTLSDALGLQRRLEGLGPLLPDRADKGYTVGWAEQQDGESLYDLLARADATLLTAKRDDGPRA